LNVAERRCFVGDMHRRKSTNRHASGVDRLANEGFHLMAKPAGPACNLKCAYCFYREKRTFFPEEKSFRMSDDILETFIREYIDSRPGPSIVFEWQGGEPALAGLDFFRRALDLQKKYGAGRRIDNSLQTNGTLLDDEWCAFLKENNFLVGLSLDGPEAVHDAFRLDRAGRPTFGKAFNALRMMRKHGVEVNVLATVNRESAKHPLEVYRFFREQGVRFIQFIPVVEREADPKARRMGIPLAVPPSLAREEPSADVTCFSVEPKQYGEFLVSVFDEWIGHDVGEIFAMNFEWTLGAWAGAMPGMCHVSPECGQNLIVEHNGDVYSCDHYMYPAYRLGNILRDRLIDMVRSKRQIAFGAAKKAALPGCCRRCDFLFACRGGCPKHRFASTPDGEHGLNYLCSGFKQFYRHVDPSMKRMTELIYAGKPVKQIMEGARPGS
jgi:uncharacterized protein